MDISALCRAYTGHIPTLMGARGGSAVLVPLVEMADGPALLYEIRSAAVHQPGEVCFPGGRMERGETPAACALRETWEELGIAPDRIRIFGEADFLHLRSECLMRPVVGLLSGVEPEALALNPQEVSSVFTVPVSWLRQNPPQVYRYPLRPEVGDDFPYHLVRTPKDYFWLPGNMVLPVYEGLPYPLWGLTARITMHFIEVYSAL